VEPHCHRDQRADRTAEDEILWETNQFYNFISACVPSLPSANELDKVIRATPERDNLAALGDFNAGVRRNQIAWSGVIGKHGIGNMNDNGAWLRVFCATQDLVIADIIFSVEGIHKGTWRHPRSKRDVTHLRQVQEKVGEQHSSLYAV